MLTSELIILACIAVWTLIGLGVAHASLRIRRGKQRSALAIALFPNRTLFGWYNDSGERRYHTFIDSAYDGKGGETEISRAAYCFATMLYWPFRIALNVGILLWMLIATIWIHILYAPPQAGYVLRLVNDMKRPE